MSYSGLGQAMLPPPPAPTGSPTGSATDIASRFIHDWTTGYGLIALVYGTALIGGAIAAGAVAKSRKVTYGILAAEAAYIAWAGVIRPQVHQAQITVAARVRDEQLSALPLATVSTSADCEMRRQGGYVASGGQVPRACWTCPPGTTVVPHFSPTGRTTVYRCAPPDSALTRPLRLPS